MVTIDEIFNMMLGFSSDKLRKYIEYRYLAHERTSASFIVEGIYFGENPFLQSELFDTRDFDLGIYYVSYYVMIGYDIYLNEDFAVRQNLNWRQEEESAPKFRNDTNYTTDELYSDILDLYNKMMIFKS